MKLKIIAAALALSLLPASVLAAEYSIESEKNAVVSCYDAGGRLVYSKLFKPQNGRLSVKLSDKYDNMKKTIWYAGDEKVSSFAEKTPVYPSSKDAGNAFAVCLDVASVSIDDEDMYSIEAMYQGKKTEFVVSPDIKIESAPQNYLDLSGADASALQQGDVFRISYNVPKTEFSRLDLIYRPDNHNIALDASDYGVNFEKLFAYNNNVGGLRNQWAAQYGGQNSQKYLYAFGIIADKTKNSLTLMNKSGETDKLMDIDLDENTVVYLCKSAREYEITAAPVADIPQSYVPKLYDSDIINLADCGSFAYALVRIIDGTAADIAVYYNYKIR